MKRYFSYDDEYVGGTTYVEIDEEYVIKQISVTPSKYIASNRKDEEFDFYLAEGQIDVNELLEYGVSEISENQFYSVWNNYKDELIDKWNITKEKFRIGDEIEGIIEVFYPQGVIVNIAQGVVGIADYDQCRNSTKPENLYPQHKILGKVIGYDNINMWLVIIDPKVF